MSTLLTDTERMSTRTDPLPALIAIFERVLQRRPVLADDDFFDLGGDSIMAVALAEEIEAALGVRLPTTALFDAPTAAALARMIEADAARAPSFVVQLRPGDDAAPLFVTPGVSGSAIALLPLARALDTDAAVYALRAPGLAAGETPLDRIEAMVAHYLPLIRGVQPSGPYRLAGYSLGGLTALELARTLIEAGERVALVAMLDTILHPRDLPPATKARIWGRRALHHAGRLRALRPRQALPYALGRVRGLLADLGAGAKAVQARRAQDHSVLPEASQRVIEAGFAASARYRQRFFPGTLTFIEAVDNHDLPTHPDIVWRGQVRRLVLRQVRGGHLDLIGQDVGGLAASLSDALRAQDAVG